MKLSPAQQRAVDHLEKGGRMDHTYSGLRPFVPGGWHRSNALHPKTEQVVREHFAGRLSLVYAHSPKHKIPMHFVCLQEHVNANAGDARIISIKEFK